MYSIRSFLFLSLFLFTGLFSFAQPGENNDSLALISEMRSRAIFHDNFVRNTFYTWTTLGQIEELRKSKKLLSKSMSETKGYSLFDITIRDSVFKNFQIAQLLQQPQFAKKRFAWGNSWATSMGLENEKYGDQLIKIILNDSAIIGSFNPGYLPDPFQFFDLKGNKLKVDYVIENSDRLAVIYHINNIDVTRLQEVQKRKGTFYSYTGRFKKEKETIEMREFVILNKSMIKSWSHGTEEIKNDLLNEISYLERIQKSEYPAQKGYRYDCGLEKDSFPEEIECYFASNKCFNTDHYLFNKKQLQLIIDQLNLVLTSQTDPITN